MFEIIWDRDLMNPDPKQRKKIKGVIITCGYHCLNSCWCEHQKECKYAKEFTYHKFSTSVRNWIYQHFHINKNLFPWYFQNHHVDLSGTTKCPYHMNRAYTCDNCIYSSGWKDCSNTTRHKLIEEGRFTELEDEQSLFARRCKLFQVADWATRYNKNTGELWYDKNLK